MISLLTVLCCTSAARMWQLASRCPPGWLCILHGLQAPCQAAAQCPSETCGLFAGPITGQASAPASAQLSRAPSANGHDDTVLTVRRRTVSSPPDAAASAEDAASVDDANLEASVLDALTGTALTCTYFELQWLEFMKLSSCTGLPSVQQSVQDHAACTGDAASVTKHQ